MERVLSGCKAEHGCAVASTCLRYQLHLESTCYRGFNAHHLCLRSEFMVQTYPHYIPLEPHRKAVEELS